MSADTSIEWCHHTFNAWSGCDKVSAGCKNCYAAALPAYMRRNAEWGPDKPRMGASDSYWKQPLAWNRAALKAGERHRVFSNSTSDLFEARADLDPWRDRLMALIEQTPGLDWPLLTKRPEYAAQYLARYFAGRAMPPNLWMGTSVENQEAADTRIPHLLTIPARVRFLSCEPLLGAVDLRAKTDDEWEGEFDNWHRRLWGCRKCGGSRYLQTEPYVVACDGCAGSGVGISWVICGGESGAKARPMHPAWARSLRDQCVAAGVAFHFKQVGEFEEQRPSATPGLWLSPDGTTARHWIGDPGPSAYMVKVGKHAAGRLLDGRTWDEVPQ